MTTLPISIDATLHGRLRRETQNLHNTLEAMLPVAGPAPTLDDYRDHLRFLLGFHHPLESHLHRVPGLDRALPDLDRRTKSAALRRDLGPWASVPMAPPDQVPEPRSVPQALGTLYVLEGATLGARAILPILRRRGILPGPVGDEYLRGHGAETRRRWQGFLEVLADGDNDHADEVVGWAKTTFTALASWRRTWEGLP